MSYTIKGVNKFLKLSEQIPKEPEAWTCGDVSKWLCLIEMDQYVPNFREMSIDGWLIFEIEEEDLVNDLRISKKLHRKKIMKGIEILKEYKLYFHSHFTKKDLQNQTLFDLNPKTCPNAPGDQMEPFDQAHAPSPTLQVGGNLENRTRHQLTRASPPRNRGTSL